MVGAKTDPFCPNSIVLRQDKPVTFGRYISSETNVRLLSNNTPFMISRKHATVSFSKLLGKWTVIDHEVCFYKDSFDIGSEFILQ